jgi:hypothetical protein
MQTAEAILLTSLQGLQRELMDVVSKLQREKRKRARNKLLQRLNRILAFENHLISQLLDRTVTAPTSAYLVQHGTAPPFRPLSESDEPLPGTVLAWSRAEDGSARLQVWVVPDDPDSPFHNWACFLPLSKIEGIVPLTEHSEATPVTA